MEVLSDDIRDVLKRVFGYQSFRGDQEKVIKGVLAGNDQVVIMPTGAGKSLCYQIPAIINPGLTLVISPLIALMKDQVGALKANGVPAEALNSSLDLDGVKAVAHEIEQERLKLLYVSPERAVSDKFLQFIQGKKIDLIAIDEAHCVSIWGNDFRPEYTQLTRLTQLFPNSPCMALTATADFATRVDIQKQLQIEEAAVHVSSFERENIHIEVRPSINRVDQIKRYLLNHPNQAGVVYCLSRKSTESLSKKLREIGIKAAPYHARLERKERDRVQEAFQADEIQVVCATIAFGMGIDKSNIRFVIHYNLPKNVEAYYQEIGRAGRDGKPSEAILFAGFNDVATFRKMIDEGEADSAFKQVQTQKLDRIWEFAQASNCRTNFILNYFGEISTQPCGHCDNCKNPPETFDGQEIAQMALSAVVRCKERVGVQLLADILRGSFRLEVREGGYDKIKTFGIGRDIPRVHWLQYIVQLANHGAISIDYTQNARLLITPYGWKILKSEAGIQLSAPRDYTKNTTPKASNKRLSKTELFRMGLFEHMKNWRASEARKEKVSPVHVFSDQALNDIADQCPLFVGQLKAIDGFSVLKMKKFGGAVLAAVHAFLNLQKHKKSFKGKTLLETLFLYQKGQSAKQIAEQRGIAVRTVLKHMADLIRLEENIKILDFVSQQEIDKVDALRKQHGDLIPEKLAEYIPELIGLGEIELILAYLDHYESKISSGK
jgi:ATP-dependent DNA helicase RecQ